MGFLSISTGLAIYKPIQFNWLLWLCGGYKLARILHFALTIGYVLFFVIHIIQVILAGWNNFRAMITGFEVVRIKEALPVPAPEVVPVVVPEITEDLMEEQLPGNTTEPGSEEPEK